MNKNFSDENNYNYINTHQINSLNNGVNNLNLKPFIPNIEQDMDTFLPNNDQIDEDFIQRITPADLKSVGKSVRSEMLDDESELFDEDELIERDQELQENFPQEVNDIYTIQNKFNENIDYPLDIQFDDIMPTNEEDEEKLYEKTLSKFDTGKTSKFGEIFKNSIIEPFQYMENINVTDPRIQAQILSTPNMNYLKQMGNSNPNSNANTNASINLDSRYPTNFNRINRFSK